MSVAEELLTLDELAHLAKRSRRTLERDIAADRLHAIKLGRSTRVTSSEARRYLAGEDVSIIQTPIPLPRRQS